jgi:adenylyl- and sulfurtransferase ThiI
MPESHESTPPSQPQLPHLILIRFGGEVTIKARRTRTAFLRRLARNIGDAVRSADP